MPPLPEPLPRAIESAWDAELNAAEWMTHWGFQGVALTAKGPDKGIDVRADDALAQVKYEAHKVGRPALQRLVGARGLDQEKGLLFFTGSGYAEPAVAYAEELGIALFKYALNGRMQPVNALAQCVVDDAARQTDYEPPPVERWLQDVDPHVRTARDYAKTRITFGGIALLIFVAVLMNGSLAGSAAEIVLTIAAGAGGLTLGIALVASGLRTLRSAKQ